MDETLCKIIQVLEDETGLKIDSVETETGCELNFKTPKGNHTIHILYIQHEIDGWFIRKTTFDTATADFFESIVTQTKS
jgi:hypothetical protein